jgi:hypothetical protein
MGSDRQDFLGSQCELGGLSIPDFQEAFCSRCSQPECSRSMYGKTRFDQRVQNWHARLFAAPTMNPADPRFKVITSQKFMSIDVSGPAHVSSAWLDPNEVEEPKSIVVSAALDAPPVEPVVEVLAPRRVLPVVNTPFQNGMMIGPSTPAPAKDPWAAPVAPERPKETVVAPGGKIKLGGGGVKGGG